MRNIRKEVKLNEEEWSIICKKAAAANMRTGTYIRRIAVKGSIKKVDLKQLNHLLLAFDRIGVEINQIAKVANSTQSVYAKDIEEMQDKVKYLSEIFDDYLSPLKSGNLPDGE